VPSSISTAQRVGVAREVERHLGRRLEEELVGVELPPVRVLQRVARLDAEQRLVGPGVLVAQVVHVAGGDEREPGLAGEIDELRVDALLDVEARVLQLDVGRIAAEDLGEAVEVGAGIVRAVLLERLAHPPREAARQRDEARREALQELPVDPRLVVVALQVPEARQPYQVPVALRRLGEQGEVGVALALGLAVVGDVDLAAEQGLDAVSLRLAVQLDGAGEAPVVGEGHRRHLQLGGALGELGDPARSVENRVLGVDMEMDEVGGHGRAILEPGSEVPGGPLRRPAPRARRRPRAAGRR
jgi:hypothetical protein